MGRADGRAPTQDPGRLPRLPRGHPLPRTSLTAATANMTPESRMLSTQHVRFGKGPSEKDPNQWAPRRRPTSQPVPFGKGPMEKDPNHGHLASGLLHSG